MQLGAREHAVKPNPSVDASGTSAASSPTGGGQYASAKSEAPGGRQPRAVHVPASRPLAAVPRVLHGSVVR